MVATALGTSSPSTMCTKVASTSATATDTPNGRVRPEERLDSGRDHRRQRRLDHEAEQQRRHRDADLRTGEVERQASHETLDHPGPPVAGPRPVPPRGFYRPSPERTRWRRRRRWQLSARERPIATARSLSLLPGSTGRSAANLAPRPIVSRSPSLRSRAARPYFPLTFAALTGRSGLTSRSPSLRSRAARPYFPLTFAALTGRSALLPAHLRCAHGPLGPGGLASQSTRFW